MSIATITLNNRDFKLFCPKESHEELQILAEKLDIEISKIKQNNPSAPFELLLIMLALNLLDNKQKQINIDGGTILEEANNDFQIILASVFSELKIVADKLEKC